MLGKLEVVFKYSSHFFLSTWPENRPGLLFLTDTAGLLLNIVPLQTGQKWKPQYFTSQVSDYLTGELAQLVQSACNTGRIVSKEVVHAGQIDVWATLPHKDEEGRIRAIIGMIVPQQVLDFDLASYLRGLEPLMVMGYDAFIKRATSEIVISASRHEQAREFMLAVIEQITYVVDKGYCSAIRLDEQGCLTLDGWLTTENDAMGRLHLADIVAQFSNLRIFPLVTDDRRLVFVPIYCEGKPLYTLLLHLPTAEKEGYYDQRDVVFLQNVAEKIRNLLYRIIISEQIKQESARKELVYDLTKRIQASIDVNEVLEEIICSMNLLYPDFLVDVYLTVDTNTALPVKQLSIQPGLDTYSSKAYKEGKLVVGRKSCGERNVTTLATPLLGKQGIYGVLELTAQSLVNIPEQERHAISMLAEAAGTAFENAQLYDHSRNLIRELRLINELSQQLNRSLDIDEIFHFVTKVLLEIFEAEYCAILSRADQHDVLIVEAALNEQHKGKQITLHEPFTTILNEKRPVIVAHPHSWQTDQTLPAYASLMGVPLHRDKEVIGILLVSDSRQQHFRLEDLKLLEIFAQHTSLALTNAILHTEMERMVITDNLTGLNTRPFLDERVKHSLEHDRCGSLILIDIDHFKKINDTFGHQVGDEVLVQTSTLIKQCIRDSDVAARWGGEEIAVYLPNADNSTAVGVAERIRLCIEKMTKPKVTISVGIAIWDKHGVYELSVESLFHSADSALYKAKSRGRNQVILS